MLGELQIQQTELTVVLHGELDLVTIDQLRELLDDAASVMPSRLVVDLGDVPFVDILSLSAILATADGVRERGAIAVVRGASPPVRRMCALFNAADVLAPDVPLQRRAAG